MSKISCSGRRDYDLPVLARLNVHRSFLADRNTHVPVNLPQYGPLLAIRTAPKRWPGRSRLGRRAAALASLAATVARAGDLDRARVLARSISDLARRAEALRT